MKLGKYKFLDWHSTPNLTHKDGINWWRDLDIGVSTGFIGLEYQFLGTWATFFYGQPLYELRNIYIKSYSISEPAKMRFRTVEEGKEHIDKFLAKYDRLIVFL